MQSENIPPNRLLPEGQFLFPVVSEVHTNIQIATAHITDRGNLQKINRIKNTLYFTSYGIDTITNLLGAFLGVSFAFAGNQHGVPPLLDGIAGVSAAGAYKLTYNTFFAPRIANTLSSRLTDIVPFPRRGK